jgi:DNA invertase Pin-like site-specific DNA recombinase
MSEREMRGLPLAHNGGILRPMSALSSTLASARKSRKNLSLPTQLKLCKEYCIRNGYQVLERFKEEGESAKTANRTELQNLLRYCRTNKGKIHFLVVYNLTRFAREKFDHFALRAHFKSLGSHCDRQRNRSMTHPPES